MTHMHIPDGVLPVWLWVLGFLVMSLIMSFNLLRLRTMDMKKKIPLLGALSAAMLVGMSLPTEIILPGYHINLSVVTGILIGPALGFVAAFIANLILALMGHGGITVIGLNTLLLGSEAVLGHTFFYFFKAASFFLAGRLRYGVDLASSRRCSSSVSSRCPILIRNCSIMAKNTDMNFGRTDRCATFAVLVLSIGAVGWIIEAAITGVVIKFISQVKPDMLGHVLHTDRDATKH